MKTMNKVMAAMMIMTITTTMPSMADNKHHNDHKDKVVAVDNSRKDSHPNQSVRGGNDFKRNDVDKSEAHMDSHKNHALRPDVKTCTFKVSHRHSHKKVVAQVERIHGVMGVSWNPRTREVTVKYDGKVTSAHHIKHSVA